MGQTLSHGVYLPAEGERNCYSGLASNWNLLDAALGDIDGKASATHTHGNITNDGKLATAFRALVTDSNKNITTSSVSDTELDYLSGVTSAIQTQLNAKAADSDVVHKSGNETISGDKAFTQFIRNKSENLEIGVIPSSNADIGYRVVDKNNTIAANLQYTQYTSGNSQFALNLRTKDNNNNIVNKSVLLNTDQYGTWFNFRPSDNSSISLGSTNYRWSAVYSDSYYYGTTAWGLDKANVWTGNNKFTDLTVSSINTIDITQSTLASATISANLPFKDNGNRYWGAIRTQIQTDRSNILKLTVSNWKTNGTQGTTDLCFSYDANLDKKAFYPTGTNTELGTSTNKWKTLNGLNPGALSFPKIGTTENTDYIDVSGNIDLSVTASQSFVAPATGWFCISFKYDKVTSCRISAFNLRGDCAPIGSDGYVGCYIPVTAGVTVTVRVNATAIYNARIYLCQGNV